MSGFPDPIRPYWPKVTGRKQELLVISEPTPWISHWEVQLKRARRCGGPGCLLCAMGQQKQLRVVLMCADNFGRDALLELRERHRECLDRFEATVGLKIRLWRAGKAQNSPVMLEVTGEGSAVARDIKALVDSFGLPPLMGDVDGVLEESMGILERSKKAAAAEDEDISERWS